MAAATWSSLLLSSSHAPPDLVLLSLLLAIFLLSCCYYYYHVKGAAYNNYGGRQLPPGSFGLPLGLGENLHYLLGMNCPLGSIRPFFHSRLRKYGTIFKTHLLGCPMVISMDPEFNRLLLSNEGKLVRVAYPKFVEKVFGPFVNMHGKRQHQLRGVARSLLTPTAIQALQFIPIQEYTMDFLKAWSNMGVVDGQEESKKFILLYMLKFLLRLTPEDPKTLLLMDDYNALLRCLTSVPVNIPGTAYNKALKARKRIMTTIVELLNAQRNIAKEESKDVVDLIREEAKTYDHPFIEEDLADVVNGFVTGSLDTTSTLLTSLLKFLSENPHVTDELLKEHRLIQKNKKENEWLTWDDFRQMQFTKSVIKETLRLTNIVEFVARKALQDIVFRDMVIPKGWKILVNFSMLHLNPANYKNPLKFDPWRWQDAKTNHLCFTPFGGGIKTCLGPLFIDVEVAVFLHYLLTRYKWHVVTDNGGKRGETSGHFTPKMKIKEGLLIQVAPL